MVAENSVGFLTPVHIMVSYISFNTMLSEDGNEYLNRMTDFFLS